MKIDRHLSWALVLIAVGWVCIAMVLKGCGDGVLYCPPPSKPGAYIINGRPAEDSKSTVFVHGSSSCSGTMIGARTVLTAAHCEGIRYVCLDYYQGCVPVVEDLEREAASKPGARDLRILRVAATLPGPFAVVGSPNQCDTYLAQGYGIGSRGQLQEREVAVCQQGAGVLLASEAICNGDSGGPLYCGEELVGVASFGFGDDCTGTAGYVDLSSQGNAEWIEENVL